MKFIKIELKKKCKKSYSYICNIIELLTSLHFKITANSSTK